MIIAATRGIVSPQMPIYPSAGGLGSCLEWKLLAIIPRFFVFL